MCCYFRRAHSPSERVRTVPKQLDQTLTSYDTSSRDVLRPEPVIFYPLPPRPASAAVMLSKLPGHGIAHLRPNTTTGLGSSFRSVHHDFVNEGGAFSKEAASLSKSLSPFSSSVPSAQIRPLHGIMHQEAKQTAASTYRCCISGT